MMHYIFLILFLFETTLIFLDFYFIFRAYFSFAMDFIDISLFYLVIEFQSFH